MKTYIDVEGRLRVKVTALSGEPVLLVHVVPDILKDLGQVLAPRHHHRSSSSGGSTLLWTLGWNHGNKTHREDPNRSEVAENAFLLVG